MNRMGVIFQPRGSQQLPQLSRKNIPRGVLQFFMVCNADDVDKLSRGQKLCHKFYEYNLLRMLLNIN